jgi:hypothetical protein
MSVGERIGHGSHRHKKVEAGTAEWLIAIPADGQTTLRYRVRIKD